MKNYILSSVIFILLIAALVSGIWFLIKPDELSPEELAFLKQEGFLDEKGQPFKSPGLIQQNLNSPDESFEVLATKLDKNNGSYQLAFKLENRSNEKKEFYLIPVSEKDQLEFQEIKGVINNKNILAINKDDVSKQPLETLYDIQKHKKELNPELAKAYNDIDGNNYKGDPIKIILNPNSSLIAKSLWQIRLGRTSTDLEPVYFLVYGSAGGAKEDLTILNVHSHPQQGENWEVEFTTIGRADLKIIPQDPETIDDDEFTGLFCDDEERFPQILSGDVIYYPNWQCSGIGKVIHYTKTAGNHTLRFEFADQISYAFNSPGTTKQFIIGGTNDDPATTGTEYTSLMGNGNISWRTSEVSIDQVIPTGGKLSNFQVSVQTAPSSGKSWTFTIRKTNTNTNLSVTIADSAILSSVDTDEVTVAAGDKVAISAVGTGTPTAAARVSWTVQFTPTVGEETILMSNTAGISILVPDMTNYYNTLIGSQAPVATEFDGQTLFPTGGTLKKFYVELNTAPGAGTSRTFTIRLNGVAQTLTTTISNTSTTNSDTTNTVTVAAADNITIINTVSGSPAASIAKFGLVFVPTTAGQWFTAATTDDPFNSGATEYQQLTAGDTTLTTTETEQYGLAQATTAKAIYVETDVDAGNGQDAYTLTLRRNGTTNTALTCEIPSNATNCSLATDVAISANDLLSTSIAPVSGPALTPKSQIAYLFYNVPTNDTPAVSSVEDSPDSIQVGQTISFTVNWSDGDGDGVKMLICKTDAITEAASPSCPGGQWCSDVDTYDTATPLSCNYTIAAGDIGVQNYYVFVCDDWPSCNASGTAGTFTAKTDSAPAMKFEGGTRFLGGFIVGALCDLLPFFGVGDLFNGTGQGFTGGSQADGGIDDYNNTGSAPTDRYEATWTACDSSNSYCGTGDAFADAKDNNTGLVWSKPCSGLGCSTSAEPAGTDYEWTYTDDADNDGKSASELCSQDLGATHDAGWSLPHQKQLIQAYIDGSYGNLEPTGSGGSRIYWSATTYSTITADAWYTYLSYGSTGSSAKSDSFYVRCVRQP